MRTVVGLDTDSKGWAAVALNGRPQSNYFKSTDKNVELRRVEAVRAFRDYLAFLPPESMIFCEEPLALKNGMTTRILNLAAGALWAQNIDFGFTWFWVDVASWKREIIGNGNANKLAIMQTMQARGLDYPELMDLYDAHAIAFYGVRQIASLGGLHDEDESEEQTERIKRFDEEFVPGCDTEGL